MISTAGVGATAPLDGLFRRVGASAQDQGVDVVSDTAKTGLSDLSDINLSASKPFRDFVTKLSGDALQSRLFDAEALSANPEGSFPERIEAQFEAWDRQMAERAYADMEAALKAESDGMRRWAEVWGSLASMAKGADAASLQAIADRGTSGMVDAQARLDRLHEMRESHESLDWILSGVY